LTKTDEIINYLKQLYLEQFTGSIEIVFNQGGIRGIKKIYRQTVIIKKITEQ
jgi:hypothetical protein